MINIDNSYVKLTDTLRGRKPKFKLMKEEKKYIFKYGASNYEIWAELIAEQLGLQAGIKMAHYEIANYFGTIGVLTNFFLKPEEMIISSDKLKEAIQPILEENNINVNLKENTISNIIQAAYTYDPTINTKELSFELMKRWAFYGLIMESDKIAENIAFIKNRKTLSLTPDFDNSTMACLDNNIDHNIKGLQRGAEVYDYTDPIENQLKLTEQDSEFFLENFTNFAKKYPNQCKEIMQDFNHVNFEKAIEIIEKTNEVSVPWNVNYWVSKAIESRKRDMQLIYQKNK